MRIVKNILLAAISLCVFSNANSYAQQPLQQSEQVAIQLGAIQLGIANIGAASAQQKADALAQGRLALGATATTYNPSVFVKGYTADNPSPQSQDFRDQLEQATLAALQSPVTVNVNSRVTLADNKSIVVRGSLAAGLTTASQIFNFTTGRIPNISPGLVAEAIKAALAVPRVFRGSGSADVNLVAESAMLNALRTYAFGTRQWGPISTTSPSLPNFSTLVVNGVAPSINGLMDAASAVAANAINALDSSNPNDIAAMTASLVRGAAIYQKTSQTVVSGTVPRFGGAVAAATVGLVAQVAGEKQNDWSDEPLLNAVVSGAMTGAKRQFVAIGYGAAAGFAGTYIATEGDVNAFNLNSVAADIFSSFQTLNLVQNKNLAQLNAAILAGLRAGLDEANWTDPVNGIAGIGGIKDFTAINGEGTPLTDTVGL